MRDEKEADDTGKRGRKRGDDDEGIEPRLKVHHDQEVDENDGKDESAQQPEVRGAHGLQLAPDGDEAAARQGLSVGIHNARDLAAHRTQVAALNGGVNIDHATNVVMRDYFHFVRPIDGSDVRENLRAPGGRCIEWSVLEVLQGLNRILRSLGHQVVADAVLEIQEKHRGDLEAAAEGVQHAVGNIALRVAALGRLGPIHGYIELWVIKRLLYTCIGNTRNPLDFVQHPGCGFAIALDIGSFDLD